MQWLEIVSYVGIGIGVLQFLIVLVHVISHPQTMKVMNVVWPITGLYFPLIGLWMYYKLGVPDAKQKMDHHMNHSDHKEMHHSDKPFWQSVVVSTTHCSSGCSLGDLLGAPIVFLTGLTMAGSTLFADYVVEFVLAYILGIAFQYYGMGMGSKPAEEKLKNAIKADTWSLIAFEIGMFAWMALSHYVFFSEPPKPNGPVFWFMMQIAMMIGFGTSYPANWYLVKKGVKHAM
ncbi:DUF4396 domain-containing protein [Fictibacillus enclensis]|uniref:DUF4396 domain-containing protein n=1 Tax=Fictibacillus enclensis TaxID=1017270 RepID=UPI0024BF88AF|nr:DUF4396 domain-containing protein [Fictibacillus enclensis]WHY72107.1 DUF4396 domain-containing protein [Fictibacillus enclensis]